uniref:Phosphatidylserine synthase n=1 Tax=Rhabditophanes sp. KR3021 TaxID=114890 RepID=A0AC35UIQ4_9BILA
MAFLRVPAHGTKLTPWVPDLVFTPVSRAFERLGVYFYNRVISKTEIGLFDKRWNKNVHGPYCHWRYYGRPDTKLMDLKVSEIGAWIGRRDKTPAAFYNEFIRNVWRIHNLYYSGPVFSNTIKTIFRFVFFFSFVNWACKSHRYWDFQKAKYHCDNSSTTDQNTYAGLKASGTLFLIVSALAFPSGPFIRPHPVVWRIIFGVSVIYMVILQFTVFQSYRDIKEILKWLDPERLQNETLQEKEYAVNCSDITLERLWEHMDIFAVAHFLGWTMKGLLIRHTIICWYISIAWELTEVVFTHILPNFAECWWDALGLDVILCNGTGIFVGMWLCKKLEMREFHWESIKTIRSTKGKFKRAVLQFTPESWLKIDWFTNLALKRTLWVYLFVLIWIASELNTFFLKHIFVVDTSHPAVFWRIILIGLISAPSIRQFYVFATDPRMNRLGMQAWVYCAICALEATINVKFGRQELPGPQLGLITLWILVLAMGTFATVWVSVMLNFVRHAAVRVRFAPSPTGSLHLGSLRTALFNYLFAKKYGGKFILRLEDTDQARLVPGTGEMFEKVLQDFGLALDESPIKGGSYGSYKQSERLNMYKEKCVELIDRKHAYHCFCSAERLDLLRKNAIRDKSVPKYDGKCRSLKAEEVAAKLANGESSVVRFKFDDQVSTFKDIVYGSITQKTEEGDFVILKSDSFPTYHFANVVDDKLMKISHVIRGMEWLSSTGKHVHLYKAFNWSHPEWLHLPLITKQGDKKLSKRDADAFVDFYTRDQGYLPLGLLNFLIRNGSGISDFKTDHLYSLQEMVDKFDKNLIGKRSFMLDQQSLEKYGQLSFKEADFEKDFYPQVVKRLNVNDKPYAQKVFSFIKEKEESINKLSLLDQDQPFGFFFGELKNLDKLKEHFDLANVERMISEAAAIKKMSPETFKEIAHNHDMKYVNFFKMIRLALVDSVNGPPISEMLQFFSTQECKQKFEKVLTLIRNQQSS